MEGEGLLTVIYSLVYMRDGLDFSPIRHSLMGKVYLADSEYGKVTMK